MHENDIADFNDPLVEVLESRGGIIIGKTNIPEFSAGDTGANGTLVAAVLLSQSYLCTLHGATQEGACLQVLTHSMLALGAREIHGTPSFQLEVHQAAQRPPWLQGR